MSEKICSIIIELPNEEQEYLNRNVGEACKQYNLRKKNELHMSIEPSFKCISERFREGLKTLAEWQPRLDIQLDKIDLFENMKDKLGLVYITTNNYDQIKELIKLHDNVEKIIKIKNGRSFVPHISLTDWGPINDTIDVISKIQITPINLPVNQLCLKKKIDFDNWKKYGRFNLKRENFIDSNPDDNFIERGKSEDLALSFE